MTIDFSDWVEVVDKASIASQEAVSRLIGAPMLLVLVIGVAWWLRTTTGRMLKVRVLGCFGIVFLVAGAYCALLAGVSSLVELAEFQPSFTTVAQERFHIDHLVCDPACPTSGLPDDGLKVAWLDDGRNVEGRLYVDGTRVTLASDAGSEGKGTE